MTKETGGLFSCRNTCWIAGGLLGLTAFLLILKAGALWALIVGVVLGIAIALVLQRLFCADAEAEAVHHAHVARAAAVTTGAGASPALAHDHDDQAAAAAEAATSAMMGDEEAASGLANEGGRSTPAAALNAAAVAADEPAQAPREEPAEVEVAAEVEVEAEAETEAEATPDYDGDGLREGTGEGTRPEALAAARDGKADDLKLIKGIGPKLEQLCNELGFYHYDQIANWSADEIAWVNANLKGFKGRVTRDDWVAQAKVLAAGGETEFAKRAEKSGMYDK